MTIAAKSHNPGFLSDADLRKMFCVRVGEFESVVETLRENTGRSNQHVIVVGPRGSGKTTLLLRVASEIRSDSELSSRLYPVMFAEESYGVGTCGEFWLECLSRLADQVRRDARERDLSRTVEEMRKQRDDRLLREHCLGALLDFADQEGKRLVLGVENLNMMFSDMMDPDAGWYLRKTLQTEPQIMLVGTATSRFGEIDRPDRALYDLFRVLTLHPLDRNESATLCETVAGRPVEPGAARRLQIITGGSPRLLAIMARFAAATSFRTLMADLLDLVDEHTAYFKSHLESLPAQERRVYLALLELWKPATAREVAQRARMETSACSAQLGRLMGRGVVSEAGGTTRRRQYYVSERLYAIYYLLRRSRGTDGLARALVDFMEAYYAKEELEVLVDQMVADAPNLDPAARHLAAAALRYLSETPVLSPREATKAAGKHGDQAADAIKLLNRAVRLRESGRPEDALGACDDLIRDFAADDSAASLAGALAVRAGLLREMDRTVEAMGAYGELERRFGSGDALPAPARVLLAQAHVFKAALLLSLARRDESIAECDKLIEHFGDSSAADIRETVENGLLLKGSVLGILNRSPEQRSTCDEALRRLDESDRFADTDGGSARDTAHALGLRTRMHMLRLLACISLGDHPSAVDDIQVLLGVLPELDALPEGLIRALLSASVVLGLEQMATLIRASRSSGRLLPLTTALELEMGLQPRVAIEVREVAEDIRRDLAQLRTRLAIRVGE